ncbi:MAG: hypothetical protein A3J83_07690 [Elusimicrobia bacterium RIFOXYA2_FULL_40_6]|nr:MAG: hypothetical protein A3J83_07690 [Elusimicrobia bacterium RIFOXYA2_FULL_40_6]
MNWKGDERRKKVLTERKIQLQFLTLIIAAFVVILILIEVHIYSFLKSILPRIQFATDHSYILGLGITIMVEMLVIISVVGYITVVHSHRIVGPFSRVQRELGEMEKEGKYRHLKVRKKDLLIALVEKINILIDRTNK